MTGANLLVSVLDEKAADAVYDKGEDGQNSKGPRQTDVLDHCVRPETVTDASEARAAGCKSVCEGPLRREPLGNNGHRCNKEKAHAQAEGDALTENQVPYLAGEGSTNESNAVQGQQGKYADNVGITYVSSTTPMKRVVRVPYTRIHIVATGDTSKASSRQ